MCAVAAQRHAHGVDGLHRGNRVALDAGDLNQAAGVVASQSQVVLHADLGRGPGLRGRAAHHRAQRSRGHAAGGADLALAADFGAADAGVQRPGAVPSSVTVALFVGATVRQRLSLAADLRCRPLNRHPLS
jgi:hypothetical protein